MPHRHGNDPPGSAGIPRLAWLSALLFLALPADGAGRAATGSAPAREESVSFVSDGRTVKLLLATDKIGVTVQEGITQDDIIRALARSHLRPSGPAAPIVRPQKLSDRVYLLELARPQDSDSLADLARNLAGTHPSVFQRVGLVVRSPGADTPMILTDEIVVQFQEGTDAGQADLFREEEGLELLRASPFIPTRYVFRDPGGPSVSVLSRVTRYDNRPLVRFAYPNFVVVHHPTQAPWPDDNFFKDQWSLENTKQDGGLADADVDAQKAWQIRVGDARVVIAIMDDGFEVTHPDLAPNRWINQGEDGGSAEVDDDGNLCLDDLNGCDFREYKKVRGVYYWDGDPSPGWAGENHGTATAGIAAAFSDNLSNGSNQGVVGACPKCRLMFLRYGDTLDDDFNAFSYAKNKEAAVVSNSWILTTNQWTPPDLQAAITDTATNGRGGKGSVVLFGMVNDLVDDCGASSPSFARLQDVIGVSCSTNQDMHGFCGTGKCLSVLAPSGVNPDGPLNPGKGTANIATTDRTGCSQVGMCNGYNDLGPRPCPTADVPQSDEAYTRCFGGTSASTPLVAGIAGLVLTADPGLTRTQVQNLLQDTADRIQDTDAFYDAATGFSSTSGYGRVNAYEAVRVVAPVAAAAPLTGVGRGGVDLFLRDNWLDWGNTEQPSITRFTSPRGFVAPWASMDVKVDAPPFLKDPGDPPLTAAEFGKFVHETALANVENRIYVRVRNRGPRAASQITVKLDWAFFPGPEQPKLPTDFWALFPGASSDQSIWHSLGTETIPSLPYCGGSGAGADPAVLQFVFRASAPNASRFLILAIVHSPDDPVSVLLPSQPQPPPLLALPFASWDNNVTLRVGYMKN